MGWARGRGVRRPLALSGVALAVCLGGILPGATAAGATVAPAVVRTADSGSGTSAVSGTLVVPGPAAAPGGVTVTLTGVPTTGDAITRTAVSKADGTFTFRDLAGGDWIYTITAPYQGATFSTDTIKVPAGQGTTVKLPLFPSTDSAAKVRTASWTVWLDVTGDRIAVQQDLALTNLGSAAYTGTTPVEGATPGAKAAVQLPIAPAAETFQYLGRFEVCCSAVADGTWVHTRPINPGGSSGTLRYEAPIVGSLAFRAQFATEAFTMLVPESTTVSSAQLTLDGTSTDRGITYKVYKASALKSGDTITVSLNTPAEAASSGTPWWLVVVAVVAVVAVVLGVWVLLRRRRTPAPVPPVAPTRATGSGKAGAKAATSGSSAKAGKGATTAKAATSGAAASRPATAPAPAPAAAQPASRPAPPSTAGTAERSRAEVLAEELAQLDLKFESGELSDEAAYRRVRESLVQRLVETVEQDPTALSTGDAGAPAAH
jgi:hypothetical protein